MDAFDLIDFSDDSPAVPVYEHLEPIIHGSDDKANQSINPTPTTGKGKRSRTKKKLKALPPVSPLPPIPSLACVAMSNPKTRLGQLASREDEFSPLHVVSKYPYRYLNKAGSEVVSKAFFDSGQFRARGWSLYYIHTLLTPPTKPLILLPAIEVEALFHEINEKLDLQLEFPSPSRVPGFLLKFSETGSPRPRYLGRLTSTMDLDTLERSMPAQGFREPGETEVVDERSFAAFRAKMEAAALAVKHKSKASKEKRKNERVVQKISWCSQLKRAQRYIGVRPCRTATVRDNPLNNSNLKWEDFIPAHKAYEAAAGIILPELDVEKLAPYAFDGNVIFICVDVESYEREHKAITEIGVSTLDTADLISCPPGEGGTNWMGKIRSRHFRIRENSHLVNKDFIAGCADRFEKRFGTSEWISIDDAPKVVASCFRPPFSAFVRNHDVETYFSTLKNTSEIPSQPKQTISDTAYLTVQNENAQPKRNIIFVAHDAKSDIDYLRGMGYDISNLSNLLEVIDTVDLYRALKQEQNPRNLGQILLDLGLIGWNLHNAGNDAAYTLQALLGITVRGVAAKDAHQALAVAERAARSENVGKEAQDRVVEEGKEWELAEEDGGDGGVAVAVSQNYPTYFGDGGPQKIGAKSGGNSKMRQEGRVSQVKQDAKREEVEITTINNLSSGRSNEANDFPKHHESAVPKLIDDSTTTNTSTINTIPTQKLPFEEPGEAAAVARAYEDQQFRESQYQRHLPDRRESPVPPKLIDDSTWGVDPGSGTITMSNGIQRPRLPDEEPGEAEALAKAFKERLAFMSGEGEDEGGVSLL